MPYGVGDSISRLYTTRDESDTSIYIQAFESGHDDYLRAHLRVAVHLNLFAI